MSTVTLNPSSDTFIDANSPTTNFDGNTNIDVGEYNAGSERRRTLIKFDLSSIPAASVVNSATLRLYNTGTDLTDNSRTFDVYRVRRAWIAGQATWNVYTTGNSWTTAGCGDTTNDREGTALGSISCVNPPSAGYQTTTLTASSIQEMLNGGTFTNNGFVLIMQTENNDLQRFNAVETASNMPELIIDYTPPDIGGFIYMSV
jgi:hypothetical protein